MNPPLIFIREATGIAAGLALELWQDGPALGRVKGMPQPCYRGRIMQAVVRVDSHGRIVIPVGVRRALGMSEGDELVLRVVDSELRLTTTAAAIARAQAVVRRYVPEGRSLVEELLQERHDEALEERNAERGAEVHLKRRVRRK